MPALSPQPDERLLCGWGRTAPSLAAVVSPASAADVATAVKQAMAEPTWPGGRSNRGLLPRGLGRSYGDAAQNSGGTVIDLTRCTRLLGLDLAARTVTVEAGMSLDRLLRLLVPLGLFVPVSPGTRYVTVGGALACDIHGKNHHVDGSFSDHVLGFDLVTAAGETLHVRPGDAAFLATAGGMGLTGVVTVVTLRLLPVETAYLLVETERASDLDDCMSRLAARDADYRYSVAWIDTLARGRSTGRAVLTRGGHASPAELPTRLAADPLRYSPRPSLPTPGWLPGGLLSRATVRAFNEVWYRKAPRERSGVETVAGFFHPLDGVRDWNRIYGPHGFLQYQYVVPAGAGDIVRESVHRLSAAGCPSFLAVLKRFGPGNAAPLSFPQPGWTLALDLPAALPGLAGLLDGLDLLVANAGGRVYLAKDSRLRPDLLAAMYPRLSEWRRLRDALDPAGRLHSDLGRRLSLC